MCKLKSLYGLKQFGHNWNLLLHDHLTKNGFVHNHANQCVYSKKTEDAKVILLLWVDDLIIAASDDAIVCDVEEMVSKGLK